MSRHRSLSSHYGFAACLLLLVAGVAACEEDGKTTPADCPPLPLYDIQKGPNDDQQNEIDMIEKLERASMTPCITPLGHAVNQPTVTETAGTGGTGTGGSSTGGSSTGGTTATDAGAAGVGGN